MNVEVEMLSASKATRLSVEECESRLRSNLENGLRQVNNLFSSKTGLKNYYYRQTEITERRNFYGSNELKPDEPDPIWKRYLQQFKDPLIGLLVASAAISVVMGQYDDAVSISVALVIVVSVGFIQEHRSEKALEQLTKLIPPKARVIRSDIEQDVYASELVSGDIVILKAGDRVPADIRIVSSNDLLLEESSMTGETKPQVSYRFGS